MAADYYSNKPLYESIKKLPKETIERIEKEAQSWWHTAQIITSEFGRIDAYKQGAQSEALRSLSEIEYLRANNYELALESQERLTEIEKLKEEIKSLEYWQKEKEIEVNLEQVSLAVGEAEKEFNEFHQQQLIELKAKYFELESQNKELMEENTRLRELINKSNVF